MASRVEWRSLTRHTPPVGVWAYLGDEEASTNGTMGKMGGRTLWRDDRNVFQQGWRIQQSGRQAYQGTTHGRNRYSAQQTRRGMYHHRGCEVRRRDSCIQPWRAARGRSWRDFGEPRLDRLGTGDVSNHPDW